MNGQKSSLPRALLAASTGGHLAQLVRLQNYLPIAQEPTWITFDHPQSRSLLADQDVHFVPYIAPRDLKGALVSAPSIRQIMRSENYDIAISTGAAIAAVVLPYARLQRRGAWYIESVSRFDGPSLTGKIVSRVPGIETFTQHEKWADSKWKHEFSVLRDYSTVPSGKSVGDVEGGLRVLVTLGTIKPYRFDRLVDRLLEVIPTGASVTWQIGETTRDDLPGSVHRTMPAEDLQREIVDADVVVSHAGVGSAMQIMDLGKCPVLIPRRRSEGEHVDDHQQQIARELSKRKLAIAVDASEVDLPHFTAASQTRVKVRTLRPPSAGGTSSQSRAEEA